MSRSLREALNRPIPRWVLLLTAGLLAAGIAWIVSWIKKDQRESRERYAATCLRAIASAEFEFRQNDRDENGFRDFWTGDVSGLYHHGKLLERPIAWVDAKPLFPVAPQPARQWGYLVIAMDRTDSSDPPSEYRLITDPASGRVHHPSKFGFCAYPLEYGVDGMLTLIIDESTHVFSSDTQGKPVLRRPTERDLKEQWRKAE